MGEKNLTEEQQDSIKPEIQRTIKLLSMYLYKNTDSAKYLFQWHAFFKKILTEEVRIVESLSVEIELFISGVYELTSNYELYLSIKLESLCNRLCFSDFNHPKLRILLQIMKSSKRLNIDHIQQIIQDTLLSEKYS